MAMAKLSKISMMVLTLAAIALTASTFAAINVSQNVTSTGTIVTTPNIGVYSNSACTTNMTAINWGTVAAGGSVTQTVYVKNTGTGSITLSLSCKQLDSIRGKQLHNRNLESSRNSAYSWTISCCNNHSNGIIQHHRNHNLQQHHHGLRNRLKTQVLLLFESVTSFWFRVIFPDDLWSCSF